MASVGEGAARGLESGFRLAMAAHQQQRSDERQDALLARQERLDTQAQTELERTRKRQESADQLTALNVGEKDLAARAAVYAATPPDPQTQAAFAMEVRRHRDAKAGWVAKHSGQPDTAGVAATQAAEQAAVANGTAPPDVLLRHVEHASDLPIDNFMRGPNGEPSTLDKAREALVSDDPAAKIQAFNVLLRAPLQRGVGQDSPHGGKIVAKEIDHVVPDPKDPDRVIPTLKVWIREDRGKSLGSGDEDRARRARVLGPDAPPGATGFYFAPMTEGRSADRSADPNVKSVSISEAMGRVDKLMQLGELMNAPEGRAAYQQYKQGQGQQADPAADFAGALTSMGVQPQPKLSTTSTPIAAGASLHQETRNTRGELVSERTIQGNEKTYRPGLWEDAVAYQKDHPDLTIVQVADMMQKGGFTKQPSKYSRGLGGGTGGGGGEGDSGGKGLTKAEDRKINRQIQTLKEESASIDNEKRRAREEYTAEVPKPGFAESKTETAAREKKTAELKVAYDKRVQGLEESQATNTRNRKGLQSRLDMSDDAEAGTPGPGLNVKPTTRATAAPPPTSAAPAANAATYARNPKTGERIMLEGGKWVPAK